MSRSSSTIDLNAPIELSRSTSSLNPADAEKDLTEEQLRQIYDNEEIERFINLFSTFVTEVQVLETPKVEGTFEPNDVDEGDGNETWASLNTDVDSAAPEAPALPPRGARPYISLSEECAKRFLVPFLSRRHPPDPPFTVGRLRLTMERLYLAMIVGYAPFLSEMLHLATWEDYGSSFLWCSAYWILWWHDLLPSALVSRMIYAVIRRRIFAYPSLDDLRRHRAELSEADEFGAQISARLSTTSSGMKELWKLFRLFDQTRKKKLRFGRRAAAQSDDDPYSSSGESPRPSVESNRSSDDPEDSQLQQLLLELLNATADFHERIHNILLWRSPTASKKYIVVLCAILVVTLFPVKYLVKAAFLFFGAVYWHLLPVLFALPSSDRRRVPPLFGDAPTDAEYAMQLISKRVEAGLDIRPNSQKPQRKRRGSVSSEPGQDSSASIRSFSSKSGEKPDKKKFSERLGLKFLGDDTKRLFMPKSPSMHQSWPPKHPMFPGALGIAQPQAITDSHSFPCQHLTGPGMITLTPRIFYFTPMLSQNAKVMIPMNAVKGVKKSGLLKGLLLRWVDDIDGEPTVKEERFIWVSERDELFARLVGADGRRYYLRDHAHKAILQALQLSLASMFFSADLLARRDSGFGLLWLAATLGSKSSVKKLSKRSVLDADITQLCELISAPAEPLALRFSSNLMFGVVRVYKVKQELFMVDVGNCVTSLKKVVQELRPSETALQMPNPVARVSTVTLSTEPMNAYILGLDADWDSYANVHPETSFSALLEESDVDVSDPKRPKKKQPSKQLAVPEIEVARRDPHTLEEHHEHLLSASFDASFYAVHDNDPSSSQMDGGFDFLPLFSDLLDVGDGLGDDLAREIGWNTSPAKSAASHRILPAHSIVATPARPSGGLVPIPGSIPGPEPGDMPFDFDMDLGAMSQSRLGTPCPARGQSVASAAKENSVPPPSRLTSVVPPGSSPRISFSQLFLSQDLEEIASLRDITAEDLNQHNAGSASKKNKRTRLLLDARTELTDEELKVARSKYAQSQADIRKELLEKRLQKESLKFIEDRIWGAPSEILAPELADFWRINFKVQVEAKSGVIHIHNEDVETGQPVKKRKITHPAVSTGGENIDHGFGGLGEDAGAGFGMEFANGLDETDLDAQLFDGDIGMIFEDNLGFRQSSEEPGQARHLSHAPSLNIADIIATPAKPPSLGSQKTSFFPWDHAGPSSSIDARFGFGGSDIFPEADVRLRSRSLSQPRTGSLVPSRRGSVTGLSPVISMHGSQLPNEDFVFDVGTQGMVEVTQQETQESEMNIIALERNSANFLEYTKMQYQGLSHRQGYLAFENIVPKETSTRHVAAAAFYHCLMLATKDALRLEQPEATANIRIHFK